jgi:hypothetical protein
MRKFVLLFIILLGIFMLFITACGKKDNNNNNTSGTPMDLEDITPEMAEWAIMIFGTDATKTPYMVNVVWIGGTTLPTITDTATLEIDGTNIMVQSYSPGYWFGGYDAVQGADCTVKFVYNGVTKVNSTIRMVNLITGSTFPTTYNPAQTANFSWTLPANNQHQLAGVSAYKDNYPAESWSDDYVKEVSADARSYTVPANPIANVPAGATYSLGVTEVNYKIVDMVALMAMNGAWSDDYAKNAKPERMRSLARNVINALSD